jgi:hypothetical protein
MKTLCAVLSSSLLLAVSCTSSSSPEEKEQAPTRKNLSQRLDEEGGYKQDASGNWKAKSDKRSPYETQGEASQSKKSFNKQTYKTGDYAKTSFWGNKEYAPQSYAGKTDGSRFQKTATQQGQGAREAQSAADIPDEYGTNTYGTHSAREAGAKQIDKPRNAEIENRRKVFDPPGIIDWKEQRALSLDQSKGILGR